jgi:cytidylate kinase
MLTPFLATILFIFGPSCGGKSSLSKALLKELNAPWHYLDRDLLIEKGECSEELADQELEKTILEISQEQVIVDAQIPWRSPRKEKELYVLVYAPLPKLLERDAFRTDQLKRSPKRAHYAQLYVKETFFKVFEIPTQLEFQYDLILDSSQSSISSEVAAILNLLSLTQK